VAALLSWYRTLNTQHFSRIINRAIDSCGVILFSAVFFVVLLQVFFRYVLNSPLIWTEELARYAFIWICYIGWVIGSRNHTHLNVQALLNLLPPGLRRVAAVMSGLLTVGFTVALGIAGFGMTAETISRPTYTLFFTYGFIYLIVPLAMAAIAGNATLFVIRNLRKSSESPGSSEKGKA
jgi:TRAP-type C4-dicarboxylate transport system permease small subunit